MKSRTCEKVQIGVLPPGRAAGQAAAGAAMGVGVVPRGLMQAVGFMVLLAALLTLAATRCGYSADRPDTAEIDKYNYPPPGQTYDKDKVWFEVSNNDPDASRDRPITDFHVYLDGAEIVELSGPKGWTSSISKDKKEGTWKADKPENGIHNPAHGGEQEKNYEDFDVKIKDNDNVHRVVAWVTYDGQQTIGPPSVDPGTVEPPDRAFSVRYFDQYRAAWQPWAPDNPWKTKRKEKAVIHCCLIEPIGGSLEIGTVCRIAVPPGAVAEATLLSGYAMPYSSLRHVEPVTTDNGRVLEAVCLSAEGLGFSEPVSIALSYASHPTLRNPRAYAYSPLEDMWHPVPESHVDAQHREVVFQTTHFSRFGVGGEMPPVGGLAELPGGAAAPVPPQHRGIVFAVIAAGAIILLGAGWYVRKRRVV